jgi:hypothetical protein
MQLNQRINAFVALGHEINKMAHKPESYVDLFALTYGHNKWFDQTQVCFALAQWADQLTQRNLEEWLVPYKTEFIGGKTIALVLAGNIPLVGFHDILSALISGHNIQCKSSSKDPVLTKFILEKLLRIEPRFNPFIQWMDGPLKNFDGVIATGSNNSALHFEHYFKNYPNIIRKNRTSIAVLKGDERPEQLSALAQDIFRYFGLGCRNVSKLYVPRGFDFQPFFGAAYAFGHVMQHDKYMNNYDYNKAVYLMGQVPLLDNEFLLLKEDTDLVSPIAVVFYEYYDDPKRLNRHLQSLEENIQCIVGAEPNLCTVDFGQSQCPHLSDYADGVDTLAFMNSL